MLIRYHRLTVRSFWNNSKPFVDFFCPGFHLSDSIQAAPTTDGWRLLRSHTVAKKNPTPFPLHVELKILCFNLQLIFCLKSYNGRSVKDKSFL